jgi:ABC-type phosphate transport system permease subunit
VLAALPTVLFGLLAAVVLGPGVRALLAALGRRSERPWSRQ